MSAFEMTGMSWCGRRLRLFDFDDPTNNHFLCVRELWVRGDLYRKRTDIIGFVNGLPLLFIECKNIHKNLKTAFEKNFSDYLDTIPHIFHHNAIVMFGNGEKAKIGTISSKWEHFHEWKRLAEQEPGAVDMETLLKGVCDKRNFLDLLENFILFDESRGEPKKILAKNHQFLGVNRAIDAVRDRKINMGKLGVFWHTQGAGKSYSMVMLTRKVHRKLGGNFTFLLLTDRDDLDTQLYKTFAGCGVVDNDREQCRASSGEHLGRLLAEHKAYIFSLVQKFNRNVDPSEGYTLRDDIIVITDEAHRTQYGTLALNMRNALPNASFMGFTGTPLFKDDEITRRVFGDYVSTYDFQRAVEDKATVPLYYDARGEKLGLDIGDINERIAQKLEELETDDIDVAAAPGEGTEAGISHHHRRKEARSGGSGLCAALLDGVGIRQGDAGLHRQDNLCEDVQPDHRILGRTHRRAGKEAAQISEGQQMASSRRRLNCSVRSNGCGRQKPRSW